MLCPNGLKSAKLFQRMNSTKAKIVAPPMVYISGEEYTRYAGKLYLEQWIQPHVDTRFRAPSTRLLRSHFVVRGSSTTCLCTRAMPLRTRCWRTRSPLASVSEPSTRSRLSRRPSTRRRACMHWEVEEDCNLFLSVVDLSRIWGRNLLFDYLRIACLWLEVLCIVVLSLTR